MSINNREDANKYYQVINELIDDYILQWKIRPSNLKRYLQPGSERFHNFLEKNGLKDIQKAKVILKDILEDRESMEKDGVIKFESFKIMESDEFKIHLISESIFNGIGKANNGHEKILADYYDTSLGHIDIINGDKHTFKLDNWKSEEVYSIVYNIDEFKIIKENIKIFTLNQLKKEKIKIGNLISIDLNTLIDEDMFNEKIDNILTENKTIDIITNCLGIYEFSGEFNNYFIWKKNNQ